MIRFAAVVLTLIAAVFVTPAAEAATPPRPQGPCDIYGAAGTPCVAAHSTTRALLSSYNGPLYQVKRLSDNKTLDIGVVQPGGYANAPAQDAFCVNALCVISLIYDQSGKGNHLYQGAPGTFKGPAKGAFDTQPIADMAPITISGHKAYGVFIIPGMGFRNNNASGIAVNDEPEGIYYVIDGKHYDSGCCFDYGNSSTNGRAVGTGTMETTYFGTATAWGSGAGPGPWIMSDMEAGLFSGYNAKQNAADPTVDSWRFVTAVVDGGGGNKWDLRGGNAQSGALTTYYSGVRPGSPGNKNYYPMRRQGGILLGTGGDNGNGSSGTFYEGVMTAGYPSEATTDSVQANVVAAKYDVQRISVSRIQAFAPGSTQQVTATFTNTTGSIASGVKLSVSVPAGWTALASGKKTSSTAVDPVAPGASASATFDVTPPSRIAAGFLTAKAEWTGTGSPGVLSETAAARVRNVLPVKINEVRFSTGANPTNQFIELYNTSAKPVDISNWSLVSAASQWAPDKLATIPPGTALKAGGFYLLGLSGSGLAAPASLGAATIDVRNTAGFAPGQKIDIGAGTGQESRTIVSVGSQAAAMTTVFIPVSTGPWISFPAGAAKLPVTSIAGFEPGQKIGIDAGGHFEVATVTKVGTAATQTTLAAAAVKGGTNIKLAADSAITIGDTLTVGTGGRKETVKVASVGTTGANGTGVTLAAPLRFDQMSGIDVSDPGTGIGFSPATRFAHLSGDAVQALGSGITLDRPLAKPHALGSAVVDSQATAAGYQGSTPPQQWFGSALSASAGSIALLDPSGAVVIDAIVYGSQQSSSSGNGTIASPELATLMADQTQGGCIVVVPPAPAGAGATNRSVGRFPDGHDTGSMCHDFQSQAASTLALAAVTGIANIKIASVAGFSAGQTIQIDSGAGLESAVVATVGTAGATTMTNALSAGATVIPVPNGAGFTAGQAIAIDDGANLESAIVVSASRGGRGGAASITVASPLKAPHAAGARISGTGITLAHPLTHDHAIGAQVAVSVPTPGEANKY